MSFLSRLIFGLVFVFTLNLSHLSKAAGSSTQFFTKAYTEGLGRAPDDNAYESYLSYFSSNGCNTSTVATVVYSVLLSQELQDDYGQNNGALVEAAYRVILNRDADQVGWYTNTNSLNNGQATFSQVITSLLSTQEFANLVNNSICADLHPGGAGYYGWGGGQVFDRSQGIISPGTFTGTTGAQLQQALYNTPAGGTVFLNQGSVITLDSTLIIPSGVVLATYGYPPPSQYLRMGRLLRNSPFTGALVGVLPGGQLAYTWVDGNNANFKNSGQYCPQTGACWSVETYGGDGTQIIYNRLSDSFGWTNLVARGTYAGNACGTNVAMQVNYNLSTQYASSHFMSDTPSSNSTPWADGLSIECDNAQVSNNQIVDASDGGIVLFASGSANQSSLVTANTILAAGNPAFAAVFLDTRGVQSVGGPGVCHGAGEYTYGFFSSTLSNNVIFTSTTSYFGIGVSAGVWPDAAAACYGQNATITGNTSGGHILRTNIGIAVSGMFNATVTNNTGLTNAIQLGQFNACPVANAVADPDLSGGLITDAAFASAYVRNCVNSDN